MTVTRLGSAEVMAHAERTLELQEFGLGLLSPEGLAASARRAASFLCPTTPNALRRAVEESLRGLSPTVDLSDQIDETIRNLVAIGDLLVLRVESDDSSALQVFLGTPAFVPRDAGAFLIGVRPEGAPLIASELRFDVEPSGHVRWLSWGDTRDVRTQLESERLMLLDSDQWLSAPRASTASAFAENLRGRVDGTPDLALIDGLRVLDTNRPVKYYRGRWRPAALNDSGYFVARRPQAYGADLWCFGHLDGEGGMRLIDLPIESPLGGGADESWRLQTALDALNDAPQVVRVDHRSTSDSARLDFFSPLPSWAQRRLDLVGKPERRAAGALFSYRLPSTAIDEELAFLERMLWMKAERAEN